MREKIKIAVQIILLIMGIIMLLSSIVLLYMGKDSFEHTVLGILYILLSRADK